MTWRVAACSRIRSRACPARSQSGGSSRSVLSTTISPVRADQRRAGEGSVLGTACEVPSWQEGAVRVGDGRVGGHSVVPGPTGRPGPPGLFGEVSGIGSMHALDGPDEFGEVKSIVGDVHDVQRGSFGGGVLTQRVDQRHRNRIGAERSTDGVPSAQGTVHALFVECGRPVRPPAHTSEERRAPRVRKGLDDRVETEVPHREADVEQGGTTADDHLPAARIGAEEASGDVRVHLDAAVPALLDGQPRLCVVHGGRGHGGADEVVGRVARARGDISHAGCRPF